MSKYADIIKRLEAATGPDREIITDILVCCGAKNKLGDWWIGHSYIGKLPPLLSSIDAAVSLVERMLPGWNWHLNRYGRPCAVVNDGPGIHGTCDETKPMAISLLIAMFLALESKEETK